MNIQRRTYVICFSLLISIAVLSCKKKVGASTPPVPTQPGPAPTPAPTIALRTNTNAIDRGQPVALQWEAKNAISVRIEPEVGAVQTQGSRLVNPSSSVTYVATATGPGGTATDSARITVRIPPAPPAAAKAGTTRNAPLAELFAQNVQTIYFDYDKSDIRPEEIPQLRSDAAWLKEHADARFTIEGYCDDRGSEDYNLGLGDRRANRVKEYLIQEGIALSRIRTVSYGEERPICREETADCRQHNRRAAFVLTP